MLYEVITKLSHALMFKTTEISYTGSTNEILVSVQFVFFSTSVSTKCSSVDKFPSECFIWSAGSVKFHVPDGVYAELEIPAFELGK